MKIDGIDVPLLHQWVGKTESIPDVTHPALVTAMAAVLDRSDTPQAGDMLPPLWHWMYFWNSTRQSELGDDGSAQCGRFLPPVPLPCRKWAGGRVSLLRPLEIGGGINRKSTIKAVEVERGKSGDTVLVTVEHTIFNSSGVALIEEQEIAYSDTLKGMPPLRSSLAPTEATWCETIGPDPMLLFRYSALTFNGYRIHYDRAYATEVEGYPGLVVQEELVATLLVELVQRKLPEADIKSFNFRAVGPLFDIEPFAICGEPPDKNGVVELYAKNVRGELGIKAQAEIAI